VSGLLLPLLVSVATAAVADEDLMQRPPWAACEYCHGHEGRTDSTDVPAIAAQSAAYIAKQLADFRSGRRASPQAQMQSALALLDRKDEADVARHFAALAPSSTSRPVPIADDPGSTLYWFGNRKVTACVSCHAASRQALVQERPFLFGLNRSYLVRQLHAFRNGARNNDTDSVMRTQAAVLSDAEIEALASYLGRSSARPEYAPSPDRSFP
jgi:cytochrome c553